jgi:prepilin-type N-terminal cleavage/methylation domain-containing protein
MRDITTIGRARSRRSLGFTLTELLVAVAILVVVIIATARIFATVSKVAGAGEANADLLQTAQTIERQIRNDIARISRDGFLVIRNVEVPNDINASLPGPLLNAAADSNARVRADQLLFIAEGTFYSTQFSGSKGIFVSGSDKRYPVAQATAARVYYGHGYQLPFAPPAGDAINAGLNNGFPVLPWTFSPAGDDDLKVSTVRWDTGAFIRDVVASQPSAREWILGRHAMLLADDGTNGFLRYNILQNDPKNSTPSIWIRPSTAAITTGPDYDSGVLASRVDIAGSTIDKIRQTVTNLGAATWSAQRTQILRSMSSPGETLPLRYPRFERAGAGGSTERADQMLTNPALAYGCSSFIVDWTWEDGVGRQKNADGSTIDPTPGSPASGDEWVGFGLNGLGEQPWFGLADAARNVAPLSNLFPYSASTTTSPGFVGLPIYPPNIEGTTPSFFYPSLPSVRVYEAVFGFNQTRALLVNNLTSTTQPDPAVGYTPWPTALRITFTLNDPEQRYPEGRTFQFVVELPRR